MASIEEELDAALLAVAILKAENARYREALEFYADLGEPSIYIPCLIERPDIYHAPLIEKDMGQIAREALKGVE